ncbi:uncharacterized protein LOC121912697 [Thunnus maccoyii]|uniref:uncharacterized protein LOC121912697 n=1 Tax=Thunnus maccoyii TaxID=8240 RepID=UPI001C4AC13C|nr:uncharacterized protein LOC121912697 [Thunnus maccoyii]
MSGTAGSAPPTAVLGLGMDVSEPHQWHQRAAQKSRASVQTYLLTSTVLPPPTAGGSSRGTKTPLRLPSLVAKGPRRRSTMARLSLSEPSLLTPKENIIFEGFSSNRRPNVLQKRPPPPPFWKSSQPRQQQRHQHQVQSCSRSAYIHFSQAIQPSSKPRPVRRHSHNPTLSSEMAQGGFRPLAMQSQAEPLSVVGKPCLLNCSQRPAMATGPGRTQLHVFLPTEAEGEEVDSESVDEGFMDELDSKITSLKLQQGAPKMVGD